MLLLVGILNLYTFFIYIGTFTVPLGHFIIFFFIYSSNTFVLTIVIFCETIALLSFYVIIY